MLVKIGMASIAVGAVSGYALALVVERSPIFKRIGIRHPARIRQVHLDWIIMGTVLVATGLAAPNLPVWVVVLVALGGIVNPLLFLPLAFRASAQQNLVYVFPQMSACGWSGLAYIGASGVWSNGRNSLLVYGHELGHNFGLLHAGSLRCGATVMTGPCTVSEYGDPFNVMGNQRPMHFSALQKAILGWIAAPTLPTHTSGSVTYVLSPVELGGGSTYGVAKGYFQDFLSKEGSAEDKAEAQENIKGVDKVVKQIDEFKKMQEQIDKINAGQGQLPAPAPSK